MAEDILFKTALNKAMAICASREMCISDIRQKLSSWGVKDEDAERMVTHLTGDKFIDEQRFAIAFVKDKLRYNKWGRVKMVAALKMKRIPGEIIKTAVDSIDNTEYLGLLKSIIEKQRKTVRSKNEYDLKGKLLRHCLAKGFESDLVYDLLNEVE